MWPALGGSSALSLHRICASWLSVSLIAVPAGGSRPPPTIPHRRWENAGASAVGGEHLQPRIDDGRHQSRRLTAEERIPRSPRSGPCGRLASLSKTHPPRSRFALARHPLPYQGERVHGSLSLDRRQSKAAEARVSSVTPQRIARDARR